MTSTRASTKSDAILEWARRRGLGYARFDFRGHGESDGDLRSVTMTDLIADTAAVVRRVGPSVLIGSSMGGLAATWCTALHPSDVIALVLLSPALGYLPEMAQQAESFELRPSDQSAITIDEQVLRDAEQYDEDALPDRIAVPVLVVHGSQDQTVPARRSDAFCRAVPHRDKEFWLIDGGSHSLGEDVVAIIARIETFLAERGLV